MLKNLQNYVRNCSSMSLKMPLATNQFEQNKNNQAIDFAMTVFEDPLVALRWLNTTNIEFDGKKPLDFMKSHKGEKRVIDTLTRIKENVYH